MNQKSGLAGKRKLPVRAMSLPENSVLAVLALLTFIPLYFMVSNSLRSGPELAASPFGIVSKPLFENYAHAWAASSFAYVRTFFVVIASVLGTSVTTLLGAYAFARLRFPGKEVVFYVIFGLLLLPAFITLIPLYVQITDMGLIGSPWGLILPYVAAGQALGIVVLRGAIESIPEEYFEAANLDGANDLWMFRKLAVPLSMPLVIALALLQAVALWGDFVLPSLILQGDGVTVSVAITGFSAPLVASSLNTYNIQLAAFTIATIPMAILVLVMMRYFVSGLSQTAIKL